MLTTAVFAICITAPLGAIMINTLGTKWLDYDGDDPELLALHGMKEPRPDPKHLAAIKPASDSEAATNPSAVELQPVMQESAAPLQKTNVV